MPNVTENYTTNQNSVRHRIRMMFSLRRTANRSNINKLLDEIREKAAWSKWNYMRAGPPRYDETARQLSQDCGVLPGNICDHGAPVESTTLSASADGGKTRRCLQRRVVAQQDNRRIHAVASNTLRQILNNLQHSSPVTASCNRLRHSATREQPERQQRRGSGT